MTRPVRLAILLLLAAYGVVCLRSPGGGHFLDAVDLAIHETGHLVFAPFGEIITALGGTLFQLLVPLAFAGYFLKRGDRFGVAACAWWVAQNLWNISVYVADARAQELPLVGGGEHDWAFLLGEWGWLRHDTGIARGIFVAGVLLFIGSLALGAMSLKDPEPAIEEG